MGEAVTNKKKLKISVDHNLEERTIKRIEVDAEVSGKKPVGKINFAELRAGGFIKQRQKDKFTVRLKCPGGNMTLERLKAVVEAVEKYGKGQLHLSTRQSMEILHVDYHNFGPLVEMLKGSGQDVASCGPRVRVPNACGGCEYNPNGITDTQKMADTVNEKFFGMRTPHKFKVSLSGCPHDCIHAASADLGLIGAVWPVWEESSCTGCTICASACAEGAIESHPETGKPIFYADKCLYCDDCVRACPTNSWTAGKTGHSLRVGGHHGRHPVNSTIAARFLTDEEAEAAIAATIAWYQKAGEGKGRIRLGNLLMQEGQLESYVEALTAAIGPEKLAQDIERPQKITIRR